jgi:alanyl-tRNA synthetase
MDVNQLRRTFLDFFAERGHTRVASAGLIPHHPLAPLFTNAGMNQFLPYFLGEEAPPYPRATSSQKCVRIKGKHDDIENIGRTDRHLTFFEMLGNFSFGDYFKEGAIRLHWELFTEVLKLDGDRLWITVHTNDDDAAAIWRDTIGVPAERIQRMDEDNFWEMGETGPCGPCSELYYDTGKEKGADGGPLYGDEDRFREIGNLVFMEFDRAVDKTLTPLPKQNIDTGSGLERIAPILQNVGSVWDLDSIRTIIQRVESLSGKTYGKDLETDVSMRIVADHARSMTFLVSDGVFPSNEDRGYVLRRVVRRALRHAYKIGASKDISATVVDAVVTTMGEAYPDTAKQKEFIIEVLEREEHRFRQTLDAGSTLLTQALDTSETVPGATAFKLHDTYGFPIELTKEIAEEQGKSIDMAGFQQAMEQQRAQAREHAKGVQNKGVSVEAYREVIDANGATEFVGYLQDEVETKVVAVLQNPETPGEVEIFLEHTPFYAEKGGQVGDTGHITTDTGTAIVLDTTWAIPGLVRHTAEISDGRIEPLQHARAVIDVARRTAIRRNHTGTHILHWALRKVLGEHVKQAGSLVAPDRLRFDFSHFTAVTPEEIAEIERLANNEILTNDPVEIIETSQAEAIELGAIAFFGEKYGDRVRMLQAGKNSLELCGGTHVSALGTIGPIKIISESSIGSNLRRIEAVTGFGALDYIIQEERLLHEAADVLKTKPAELAEAVARAVAKQRELEAEIKALRAEARKHAGAALVSTAENGAIVVRLDDTPANELRELAMELRQHDDIVAVVLIGTPDGNSVSLVSATKKGGNIDASALIAGAAKLVGGGGGKGADMAMAGGRDPSKIDDAIAEAKRALSESTSS